MAVVGPARGDGHRGGGGFGQDTDNARLEAMLRATDTDFSAAINRSSAAAGLELSTNTAVMAIGGFGGSDPAPTLGEFQQDVANHRITYYIAPANNRHPGGFGSQSAHRYHAMGGSPLRADDGRIRDRLRPHGAAELSDAITVNGPR